MEVRSVVSARRKRFSEAITCPGVSLNEYAAMDGSTLEAGIHKIAGVPEQVKTLVL